MKMILKQLHLPNDYLGKLAELTKLYALQKGDSLDVDADDMR